MWSVGSSEAGESDNDDAEDDENDDDSDTSDDGGGDGGGNGGAGDKEDRGKHETPNGIARRGKWVRREVELVEGTRPLGYWIEGDVARVRVEILR